MKEVIVIGAGAAGLWAAEVAARGGARVRVLEKTARTGTKILASGGSRCNLTTTLEPAAIAPLFGQRGGRFLAPALAALPPRGVRARFESWGVPTVEAPLEKVFPASQRARDVRDALEGAARAAGARIELSTPLTALSPPAAPGAPWRLHLARGGTLEADAVVLACGGKSFPRTGTTGEGYRWLEELGLPLVPPLPALVPLTSPAPWVHALAGVSLQGAEVRLVDGEGRSLGRRRRPLLFTHRGVSGPGAMDLSARVSRSLASGGGGGLHLRVDLCGEMDREQLRAHLLEQAALRGRPRLARCLPDVPRRVVAAAARQAELPENPILAQLDRAGRHRLIEALKGLEIPIDGTAGFDAAEVTAGGLDLAAVDPRSLAVNALPGLYVVGELLDLDAPIGGFSFQAAFATAELCGRALAERGSR